jgi:hypothetical protein
MRSFGTGAAITLTLQTFDDREIRVYACNDYSETDVLDASGASVLSADKPTLRPFEVALDVVDSLRITALDPWDGSGVC